MPMNNAYMYGLYEFATPPVGLSTITIAMMIAPLTMVVLYGVNVGEQCVLRVPHNSNGGGEHHGGAVIHRCLGHLTDSNGGVERTHELG